MNDLSWMTGVSNDYVREAASDDLWGKLGLLLGPGTFGGPGSKADYSSHIPDFSAWACDNGCFSSAGLFDESAWLERLEWIVQNVDSAQERCRFAVAPDVFNPELMQGDAMETILRSICVLPKIRNLGIPAALVFQDGIENNLEAIPWDSFDVAFIGGGDDFKLGYPGSWAAGDADLFYAPDSEKTLKFARMIERCHNEGKGIHVGRVNTKIRLTYSRFLGADSADGTKIAFSGQAGLRQVASWLSS